MDKSVLLSPRELTILKKALNQLTAAEVAINFDKPGSKILGEINDLYQKLDKCGGEDE